MPDLSLYGPAVLTAALITVLELTEVVVLVVAMSADHTSARHGAAGATSGVAVVGVIALALGAAITALNHAYLLWGSAVVLTGFGVFLFRSTLRSYRRAANPSSAPPKPHGALQFAGGFTVGAVETTEVVVVLLALAAAGYAFSALVGAVAGGVLLVGLALPLHERLRRIKVPWLKLAATSVLFAFAVFWAGEAAGVAWPGADLILIPLVVVAAVILRGLIRLRVGGAPTRAPPAA